MPSDSLRPSRPARFGLVAAALFGLAFTAIPPTTFAAVAKPVKKDSSSRIRPKEVTLTPSVEPAEARAGETVTYRVSAKLAPGWHIYKYAKTQPDQGPRSTTFDFFDTAGLKVAGDWTASRAAIKQAGAGVRQHGPRILRGRGRLEPSAAGPPRHRSRAGRCCGARSGYQLCDARSCKIPGQWTLPDVVLTVLPGDAWPYRPLRRERPSRTRDRRTGPRDGPTAAAASATKEPPTPEESRDRVSGRRSEIAQKAEQGIDPVPARLGAGRPVRAGDAVRLADGADHGQLLRQARAGQQGQDDRAGHHLLPGDHRRLHGGRRALSRSSSRRRRFRSWRITPG